MAKWIRYRFHANPDDYRPVKFPSPGPYWCTGYGGSRDSTSEEADDDETFPFGYSVVVAYLPPGVELTEYWPEASDVDREEKDEILYTSRFPKPSWFEEP
jgi:hypothetical protein